MDHKIYFIGDIEMGRGDIMDDFSDDYILIDFIESITPDNNYTKISLVLLGDIFDYMKMGYKGKYPRYITKEISLWKTDEIISCHKNVFNCLKNFLTNKNTEIIFLIGNHDADLAWPKVQKRIRETLRTHKQVKFAYEYSHKDIHAEHGHLIDPFFQIDTKKPTIEYDKQKILNLPWGAHACFTHLVEIKKKFPREETLYPNPLALKLNKKYKTTANKIKWNLLMKNGFIDPVLHFYDPTYRVPYLKLLKHLLLFGSNVLDDKKFINHRVKKIIREKPDKNIIILGHSHVLTSMEINGKKIFITDTWRDEYDLNNEENKKPKSYVEIHYKNDKLNSAELKIFGMSGCGAVGAPAAY